MADHPPCRILVAPPADAASARAVIAFAARVAAPLGAELVLLAVAPVALPATGGQGLAAIGERDEILRREQERLDAAARARVESILAVLPAEVSARTVLGRGRPGPAILSAVREEKGDLVVVGMRRAGRAEHLLHDGADRYVLHHSSVPVIVVPSDRTSYRTLPVAA